MRRRALVSSVLPLLLLLAWPASFAGAADPDVSGRWTGTWRSEGILHIPREEPAIAEFHETGATGRGRLVFDSAGAAESVPLILRLAGATGVPVTFTATEGGLLMREAEGAFAIAFVRRGDALVGRVQDAEPEVTIVLHRDVPAVARSSAAAAAPGPLARPAPGASPESEPATPPPAAVQRPPTSSFAETASLQPIHFDFDQATIRPDAAAILDANAAWLRTRGDVGVLIEGHADERGTNEYNLALGERRARAARDYLVAHGIAATRLDTISYGEERPVCTEHTEACWSRNRRVVFRVSPRE